MPKSETASRGPRIAKVTQPTATVIPIRERLFSRLDELRDSRRLPWVFAPAGFGKTSLLVSYVQERGIPTLWYRVDEGDKDAADLFHYLRLAVERLPNGRAIRAGLPVFSPVAEIMPFARRFFEALFLGLPEGAMLVFDDFHLAPEGSTWQKALEKAFDCLTDAVGLVISSRRCPPSALARWQIHADLVVLGAPDLRLTDEEAQTFAELRKRDGCVPAATVAQIQRSTGGWAAGVSLLLRRYAPVDAPPPNREADAQPVFDYLAGTIFSELDPQTRRVLLHTACMPSFTASGALELSGVLDAGARLHQLCSAGLFITYDPATSMFQLHDLFRSFLIHSAEVQLAPEALRSIRSKGAAMLRKAGRLEDSFELSSLLEDHSTLASLVCEAAPRFLSEGRGALLERWISALPASQIAADAWLRYWRASATLTTAPALSRARFEEVLSQFIVTGDAAGAYLSWAGGLHAHTYDCHTWHSLEAWFDRFAEVERRWPAFPSAEIGSQTAGALLLGLTLVGAQPETLDHWANRALALAENAADPSVRVLTVSVLVLNYALHGDHHRTAALVARLAQEGEASPVGMLARVAAKGATAALLWQQGDCRGGLYAARVGAQLMQGKPVPMWSSAILVCGAWCAFDSDSAQDGQRFRRLLATFAELGTPLEISSFQVVRAREALFLGDHRTTLEAAQLSLDACRVVGFEYGETVCLVLIAHAAFELSELDRSDAAIADLLHIENEFHHRVAGYWRLLLEADHALQGGARDKAASFLRRAFVLGREGGLYAMHAPSPARMAALCTLALENDIEAEYTRMLIVRRGLKAGPADVSQWPWPFRVRVLGSFEVQAGDRHAISFGHARMPQLLLKAIVALAGGEHGVPLDRLASILWPDADGDRCAKSLEVTMLRLRRALGDQGKDAIRIHQGAVRIDPAIWWTDLSALDALLARIACGGASEPAQPLVDRLFELYRGPFAGDTDDLPSELLGVRSRIRDRVAGAIRELSRRLHRQGDEAAVNALATRARKVDDGLLAARIASRW